MRHGAIVGRGAHHSTRTNGRKEKVFPIWVFSKNRGTPKWMVKIMENPIKMDDLGVYPYFRKHPYHLVAFSCLKDEMLQGLRHLAPQVLCYPAIRFSCLSSWIYWQQIFTGQLWPDAPMRKWCLKGCSSCGGWFYTIIIPIISKVLSLAKTQFCELNLGLGNEDLGIWFYIKFPTASEGVLSITSWRESTFSLSWVVCGNHPKHGQMFFQFFKFKLDLPWLT